MKRVALVVALYTLAFFAAITFPAVVLPAAEEGIPSVVLLIVLMFGLGVFARRWWALLGPLCWVGVALSAGFAFPLENTDGAAGQFLYVAAVAAGSLPLGIGIAAARSVGRFRDPA